MDTPIMLGAIEQWTIKNTSNEQHVSHIHQTDFQLVSVNGEPQEFYRYNDIANISEQGEIEIIIPFTDPVAVGAPFVYHCHTLAHEDKGMMGIAQVSASTPSVSSHTIATEGLIRTGGVPGGHPWLGASLPLPLCPNYLDDCYTSNSLQMSHSLDD